MICSSWESLRLQIARPRCSRFPTSSAYKTFWRWRRIRGADLQNLGDQCRIIGNPVSHHDPSAGPGYAHHLLGDIKWLWREHRSKDTHDEIKRLIFQVLQIGGIAFLKPTI